MKDDDQFDTLDKCYENGLQIQYYIEEQPIATSIQESIVYPDYLDEAMEIKNTEIAKHLSLPPVKLHCSLLAEDAIKAAVNDYKQKQN